MRDRIATAPARFPRYVRRACASASLVFASLAAAVVGASPVYIFDYQGGLALERGVQDNARPEAVSVDRATGEVCVTEAVGSSLQVFNAAGALVFRTNLAAGLSTPASGCLDGAGRFVCTDTDGPGRRTIVRLGLLGEPDAWRPERPREPWSPLHLLVTSDGHYVSLDPAAALLAKHDAATGALMWSREIVRERAVDLGLGRPCEGDDRRLYVPGGELRCVLVRGPAGEDEGAFGEPGGTTGQFVAPIAAAPGPGGTVAVLDRMRHKVLLFGPDRAFRAEFGAMGGAPGDFYHPVALATSPDAGLAYVAQGFQGRVQVYRLSGSDMSGPPARGPEADAAASARTAPEEGVASM